MRFKQYVIIIKKCLADGYFREDLEILSNYQIKKESKSMKNMMPIKIKRMFFVNQSYRKSNNSIRTKINQIKRLLL